jgi:sugar lactone lactonase YvrE
MIRVKTITTGMIILLALCGISCGNDDPAPGDATIHVTGVTLEPGSLALLVDADSTLVATVLPEDASDKAVTWSSSDATIVTVADGKVSALKAGGPVTITVTTRDGEKSATCAVTVTAVAQLVVGTLAGNGIIGHLDGAGASAGFTVPQGMAVDASGNIYVGENAYVRKITPAGVVSTLAGDGTAGYADGTGAGARFYDASGLVVDASGNVYVADYANYAIRKITPAGVVTTVAGTGGTAGYLDGTGTSALLGAVGDVALDPSGEILYLTDVTTYRDRRSVIASGEVTTLAGCGVAGHFDGTGTAAELNSPRGLAVDATGNLYVTEYLSHYIRKITPAGVVTTVAGTGGEGYLDGPALTSLFSYPVAVAIDAAGNLLVVDPGNHRVRKISPGGVVSTLAGSTRDYLDGPALTAKFDSPAGIAITGEGIIYVSDRLLPRIRVISIK